jgi:hypothetical protein
LVSILSGFWFATRAVAGDHGSAPASPSPAASGLEAHPVYQSGRTIGINGTLYWRRDPDGFESLMLQTPSLKDYALVTSSPRINQKLAQLAEHPKQNIELGGILTVVRGAPQLEVKVIENDTGDWDGYFTIQLRHNLDRQQRLAVYDSIRANPALKIAFIGDGLDAIEVKSDLSLREVRALLDEGLDTGPYVDTVTRDGVVHAETTHLD